MSISLGEGQNDNPLDNNEFLAGVRTLLVRLTTT